MSRSNVVPLVLIGVGLVSVLVAVTVLFGYWVAHVFASLIVACVGILMLAVSE